MNAPLAPLLEFKVLDGVSDVNTLSIEASLCHGAIKEPPGRPDEGPTLQIFLVTGLFPDKCHRSTDWTLAQHGARRATNERLSRRELGIELLKGLWLEHPSDAGCAGPMLRQRHFAHHATSNEVSKERVVGCDVPFPGTRNG
jgi:hypothetical protein